ncbi:hypothetical protein C8Q78DRAFT_1045269 [Trametes maxima]|nr:hypothetical protein C8Q78DRAFT_1045269 [Trametes maxima]
MLTADGRPPPEGEAQMVFSGGSLTKRAPRRPELHTHIQTEIIASASFPSSPLSRRIRSYRPSPECGRGMADTPAPLSEASPPRASVRTTASAFSPSRVVR